MPPNEPDDLAVARAEVEAARAAARLAEAELELARAEARTTDAQRASEPQTAPEQSEPGSATVPRDTDPFHEGPKDGGTNPSLHQETAEVPSQEVGTEEEEPQPLSDDLHRDARADEVMVQALGAAPVPDMGTPRQELVPASLPGEEVRTGQKPASPTVPTHELRSGEERRPRAARRRGGLAIAAVLALALTAAGVFVFGTRDKGLPDGAALRADGVTISEDELARRTQVLVVLYGVQIPTDPGQLDTFRRATAKAVALSTVLAGAVRDQHITVPASDISKAIATFVVRQYGDGGNGAFLADLKTAGITEDDVRQELTRQVGEQKLFDKITHNVKVTDDEVRAAYDKNPAAYALPEQRQLRHIVVKDKPTAVQALADLRRGVPFVTEVSKVSLDESTKATGGELGTVSASQLEQGFAAAAFSVELNGYFGPVQTRFGWDVGQVERIIRAQPSSFSQASAKVSDEILADKSLVVWRAYLAKLEKNSDVKYAAAYQPTADTPGTSGVPGVPTPTPSGATSVGP